MFDSNRVHANGHANGVHKQKPVRKSVPGRRVKHPTVRRIALTYPDAVRVENAACWRCDAFLCWSKERGLWCPACQLRRARAARGTVMATRTPTTIDPDAQSLLLAKVNALLASAATDDVMAYLARTLAERLTMEEFVYLREHGWRVELRVLVPQPTG